MINQRPQETSPLRSAAAARSKFINIIRNRFTIVNAFFPIERDWELPNGEWGRMIPRILSGPGMELWGSAYVQSKPQYAAIEVHQDTINTV